MQTYNPFNKSINELAVEDLAVLRNVREGWYIEYKQEITKAEAIAKSISALANTYGGWLFYGIKELSKEDSVAGEFIGIQEKDVDGALQRIRQAVATMLSPDCRYDVKPLYGPCEALGLVDERAVVCVAVPQSFEAPHIHKRGLVYRRIADGSEPIAENDRHVIDKMLERANSIKAEYLSWFEEDPELSKGESERPHLRLMISTNPWKKPRSNFDLNIESAREALGANGNAFRTIPFDTFYSNSRGVIARQCGTGTPIESRLTWQIYRTLSSDISIPLSLNSGSPETFEELFENHRTGSRFCSKLRESNVDWVKVIDLNILFHVVMGVIQSHRSLLQKAGWPCEFSIKIKVLNAWRTIPFLDTNFFIENIEKNGLPLSLTENSTNPPGSAPDTFINIDDISSAEPEQVAVSVQALRVFAPIAEAFGIPLTEIFLKEFSEKTESTTQVYNSLIDAGTHAAFLAKS